MRSRCYVQLFVWTGLHSDIPWTRLATTATVGSNVIHLKEMVDWTVGEEIVISTTGDTKSLLQNEHFKIKNITRGKDITLNGSLNYDHISKVGQYGLFDVEFGAEVGLLTKNVFIEGRDFSPGNCTNLRYIHSITQHRKRCCISDF